jgi:Rrf2 family transcriptional regulator, nitric oxide-sensitive transcriptional repressor
MRLNRFTDYSLRVLIYLAQAPEGRATIGEIARTFRVSEHHLVKVVHFLGRRGFLQNSRGRKGGLRLARAPREINVGAVVRLTEADDLPAECFDAETNTCVLANGCGLQKALGAAVTSFYRTLEGYSVADLYVRPRKLQALFELRRVA